MTNEELLLKYDAADHETHGDMTVWAECRAEILRLMELGRMGQPAVSLKDRIAELLTMASGDEDGPSEDAVFDTVKALLNAKEPAGTPYQLQRIHKHTRGGNDYISCDDCGQEWDYRKPGTEPLTCIPQVERRREYPWAWNEVLEVWMCRKHRLITCKECEPNATCLRLRSMRTKRES